MRTISKIITAVALAGMAVAGGAAFTGPGLSTADQANSAQFIGGAVSQTVTGASVLENVAYTFDTGDYGRQSITGIVLTFAAAVPDTAAVTVTTGDLPGTAPAGTLAYTANTALVGTNAINSVWTVSGLTGIDSLTQLNVFVAAVNAGSVPAAG